MIFINFETNKISKAYGGFRRLRRKKYNERERERVSFIESIRVQVKYLFEKNKRGFHIICCKHVTRTLSL